MLKLDFLKNPIPNLLVARLHDRTPIGGPHILDGRELYLILQLAQTYMHPLSAPQLLRITK